MELFAILLILAVLIAAMIAGEQHGKSGPADLREPDVPRTDNLRARASSSAGGRARVSPQMPTFSSRDLDGFFRASSGNPGLLRGRRSTSAECWRPEDQTVTIGKLTIPGGLVYVGKNLSSVSVRRELEPALIDPDCPRDAARPDYSGRGMPYHPTYASIAPGCRSAYLNWLAGGRLAPEANIGYVFLYFYGLERRALFDTRSLLSAQKELPRIADEVRRLLGVYGDNSSFHLHATRFLQILRLQDQAWEPGTEPPEDMPREHLPLTLRLAVGQMAANHTPLPAAWALAWLRNDMESPLRTPAYRCEQEFDQLFRLCYREEYGEGLLLKACKRKISGYYWPASPSFRGALTVETQTPDVVLLLGPRRKLGQLAIRCSEALGAYSRWLGRNPKGHGSLVSAAFLPPTLLATHPPEALLRLRRSLEEKTRDRHVALVPTEDVLGPWLEAGKNTLPKKQAIGAARLLSHAGFGFEPDVRFCDQRAEKEGQIAVFPLFDLANCEAADLSSEYSATVVLLHLAVMVAAADGEVSNAEKQHLRDQIATGLDLRESEARRLGAYLEWLLAYPPTTPGGKKKLQRLTATQTAAIGQLLISITCADGYIDPAKIKALINIFRFLGLDPGSVHDGLHTHQARGAPGPVSTTPGYRHRLSGFRLPPPTGTGAEEVADPGVRLDPAVIAAKQQESERAALALAEIFVDEDPETEPTTDNGADANQEDVVPGLDSTHSALLRRLAEKALWSRAEYESLAKELGVLPDGALDLLNDAAFELCEEAVIEGHDPLEINGPAAQEMLA